MDEFRPPKLFPKPRRAEWGGGFLEWARAEFETDPSGLPHGSCLRVFLGEDFANSQAYRLSVSDGGIVIEAASNSGVRNAVHTLRQIGMRADERGFAHVEIEDSPDISERVFSLDLTSGRVPSEAEFSLLAERLSLMKFNVLELCIDRAYPFEKFAPVWAGTAVLGPRKIERLGRICAASGMELACNFRPASRAWVDSCGFDFSHESLTKLFAEIFSSFPSANAGFGMPSSRAEAAKLRAALPAGKRARFFADAFASDSFGLGASPVFSPKAANFKNACAASGGSPFYTSASAKLSLCPRLDGALADISLAADTAKEFSAAGFVFSAEFAEPAPVAFCPIYPAAAHAAACAWGAPPTEEDVCDFLDSYIFYDPTGEFSRCLCALGRISSPDFIEGAISSSPSEIDKFASSFADIDYDAIEASADFPMALAAESKPNSRDAAICIAEVALCGALAKFAISRARSDRSLGGERLKTELKFLAAEFERVWLARFESGGMWEKSSRLRSLNPSAFQYD